MTLTPHLQRAEPVTIWGLLHLVRDSVYEWSGGQAFLYAAALAYYTLFSIVPLLVLILNLAVYFAGAYSFEQQVISLLTRQYHIVATPVDPVSTSDQLVNLVRRQAGEVPAAFVSEIVQEQTPTSGNLSMTVVSVLFLLYGASTVFHQLLNSLNAMYGLPASYKTIGNGILFYLIARLFSAATVIILGALFVLLLAGNVIISSLPPTPLNLFLADFPGTQLVLRFVIVPLISIGLIASLYKFLPSGRMRWRDVLPGTLLTVALISIGNRVISFYLDKIFGATLYGASGTVVLFLIWIYYIGMIVLFGAKFIALYCRRFGVTITPKRRLLMPTHATPPV